MNTEQNTQCYNCKSYQNTYYAEENGFVLVKCNSCGLIYLKDIQADDEITAAHEQGLHKGIKELNVTGSFNENQIPKYLQILRDLYGPSIGNLKTWLDIGCGHGEFMIALDHYSKNSLSIQGTEPNVHKQKSAQNRGLDVSYFDLARHKKKYDGISLLNVYSHLPDPPSFIDTLKELLNPGGELIIETGDTARFKAKDHYRPFYLPDHISFASEEIITNILEDHNFNILKIKKYPYPNLGPSPHLSLMSILKETTKLILPKYQSMLIKYFQHYRSRYMYANTDMYIRAKLDT